MFSTTIERKRNSCQEANPSPKAPSAQAGKPLSPRTDDLHFFYKATHFCDLRSANIKSKARELARSVSSEKEYLINAFNFVRDEIRYTLGIHQDTASETLEKGYGSCSNKANLMVALARAVGIPAGYRIMRVRTREYFGPFCSPRFGKFMSGESMHIYLSVFTNGRWVDIDPTDDLELSQGALHLCQQATVTDFNGVDDAMLEIDEAHIVSVNEGPVASIDTVFEKKAKIMGPAVTIMNHYMDFIRAHGREHSSVDEIEKAFFAHFKDVAGSLFETFCRIEQQIIDNPRAV